MAQNIFPVTTTDEWVLISSVTPTVATTVSFTSISGYKKLALAIRTPGLSTQTQLSVTFNSDTGTNYGYSGVFFTNSTGAGQGASTSIAAANIPIGNTNGITATHQAFLSINDTSTAGFKTFNGFVGFSNSGSVPVTNPSFQGVYFASASISTVTLTAGANFAASGTVALYGVKI
jgi:hypothetical protein